VTARLVAIGDSTPRKFALDRDRVTIGSAPDNDFVLAESTVSRRHAILERRDGAWFLADTGSTNGTFRNDQRVNTAIRLRDGDELRWGAVRYRFADATAATARPSSPARRTSIRRFAPLVLLLVAAFGTTLFVINFDRMENPGVVPTAPATSSIANAISTAPSVTPQVASAATPQAPAPAESGPPDWLIALNNYRKAAGVAAVSDDPRLSPGCAAHSRYIVKNFSAAVGRGLGGVIHTEDSANPWSSAAGLNAAQKGDVDEMWDPGHVAMPSWAIDNLIQGPFHRVSMLNPRLRGVGYGHFCENGYCVATLDIQSDASGLTADAAPVAQPIEYPPNGAAITATSFTGEWPNPLASCPGYLMPAGYAITLQPGVAVVPPVTDYSLTRTAPTTQKLEACAVTAQTYVNPDPVAQDVTRRGLRGYGAIVIMPREPLERGSYAVAIAAGGQTYAWTFSVKP